MWGQEKGYRDDGNEAMKRMRGMKRGGMSRMRGK